MASSDTTKTPALPEDSLILVTGATGFMGSHIANELLKRKYRIRCTTRDTAKADWVRKFFEGKYGKGCFEAAVVSDMTKPDAFDEVVKASVLSFSPNPNEVIPITVAGMLNTLNSAAKEQSVKRFVFTSSSTAATLPKPNVEFNIDETTWNDEVLPIAWAPPPYEQSRAFAVYGASKTQAEKDAWAFMEKNNPSFVFNTILPDTLYGEILDPENQQASSGGMLADVFLGKPFAMHFVPPQYYVNVKDAALLHVAALLDPEVRNERIIAFAAPWAWNEILSIMRRARPDQRTIPEDIPDEGKDLSKVANARGEELLRGFGLPGWTSLEDTIKENIKHV
ncbi:MAG: hypothetical protein M1840_002011 [Geoglossum simile]|nr:MAG: hypothetical protein M1840_002011 [Geoglossum simile]